ncbi:MAG: ArsA-related P-loop ATPase [Terracidiphilus sp.]
MANTERAGNGEAGSRSGIESAERGAAASSEDIQAESVRGAEPGLAAGLGMKPKRVVFPIAGKGGVGKTTVMATLAEWYASTAYTTDLFDMDPDNKAEGSFKALFARAHKLPALESWTYDKLLGVSLESSADVILADLGAAQGHRMIPWFREFYRTMQESGLELRWTALGVVDGDIASARSVIEWGEELQNTVDYVIVHNYYQDGVPSAWENPKIADDVAAFREVFSPVEIRIDARRPDLQRMMRTMNVTLSDVGERRTTVPELRAPDMTLRARTYRFRAFSQFTEARKVLLP